MNNIHSEAIIASIASGQVGVIPTDTVFGVVGKASDPRVVSRIYEAKHRASDKPFIILISHVDQLSELSLTLTNQQLRALGAVWPGPVSVIIECVSSSLEYLHRRRQSLAVRLPAEQWLQVIINKTGPIVATSANTSGQTTVRTSTEAKLQLPGLDFYYDGPSSLIPSQLMSLNHDGILTSIDRS